MVQIVVIGSFNMDLSVLADRLPGPGETVLGADFQQSPGGKGSNQAIAAARLGAVVHFIGAVGTDAFGDDALALHRNEGVGTDHLVRTELPTGVALIVVDKGGENQIAVGSGANNAVSIAQVKEAASAIESANILVGQLETPIETFIAAARIAKDAGTKVLLNPAPFQVLPEEIWPLIDVFTPNEHELAEFAPGLDPESGAQALLGRGVDTVIVTRGSEGVLLVRDGLVKAIPALKVDAVDTTGAGDAFTAALAVGLAEGLDIEQSAQLAIAVGAHAVTKFGVLASLPHRQHLGSEHF